MKNNPTTTLRGQTMKAAAIATAATVPHSARHTH
jgi:hypothetical protein